MTADELFDKFVTPKLVETVRARPVYEGTWIPKREGRGYDVKVAHDRTRLRPGPGDLVNVTRADGTITPVTIITERTDVWRDDAFVFGVERGHADLDRRATLVAVTEFYDFARKCLGEACWGCAESASWNDPQAMTTEETRIASNMEQGQE